MYAVKIDVAKIDKSKLFEGKNGAKYLDVVLIDTPNDKYGNSHMVVQSVSKEEREAGVKGAILGNAKEIGGKSFAPKASKPSKPAPADDDIPF